MLGRGILKEGSKVDGIPVRQEQSEVSRSTFAIPAVRIYAYFVSLYLLLLSNGIHGRHDVKVKSSHRRRGFAR